MYIVATLSYSLYLKRVAVVDVLLLSGLYTLRLLAGGAATGTEISQWLAGFSSFLFFSLAMVKRFSELENLREKGGAATDGRGYLAADLEQIRSFGTSSAYAAVVVFMLYIARPDVTELYRHAMRLWLIVPLLIYWLNRVWLLASRGELDEDPVVFAMRDGMSLAVGAAVVCGSLGCDVRGFGSLGQVRFEQLEGHSFVALAGRRVESFGARYTSLDVRHPDGSDTKVVSRTNLCLPFTIVFLVG